MMHGLIMNWIESRKYYIVNCREREREREKDKISTFIGLELRITLNLGFL